MKLEPGNSQALPLVPLPDSRLPLILAATLCAVMIAATAMGRMLPPDAVLPALATLLFGSAAVVGLAALARGKNAEVMFDIAGVLTFLGIVVAALIEPEQMIRLVAPEPNPG